MSSAGANARSAFVTGGTGFIGGALVEQLMAAGWTVTVLHRPSSDTSRLKKLGVSLTEGSITDTASLGWALPDGLDAVFHLAASLSFAAAGDARERRVLGGPPPP